MIREDLLIEPLARFFKQRIFGAGRTSHLAALADATEASGPVDLLGRTRSIIAEIDELWARQANLITELETLKPTGDPDVDSAWRTAIQTRFAAVVTEQRTKQQILAELVREEKATAPINVGLLDLVPQTDIDITGLPEDQQRCLCDAFHGGGTAGGDRDADDHFSGERVVAQLHSRSLSSASSIRATTTTRRPKQMF